MRILLVLSRRLARTLAVVLLVAVGATVLVRCAPGYLSDAREMDARYAEATEARREAEAARSSSLGRMLISEFGGWVHGDLGVSRQYQVPVLELLLPRLRSTASLLVRATLAAWALAGVAALFTSALKRHSMLLRSPVLLLLAVPASALATICLLTDGGGPMLVMIALLGARDYKFLDRMLRKTWREPHLLLARAQGIPSHRLVCAYVLPAVRAELLALATLSLVTALSALVPVEVLFNMPGVGQLAWNAAMNRDLPVLLAVTMLMAVAVTATGMLSGRQTERLGA